MKLTQLTLATALAVGLAAPAAAQTQLRLATVSATSEPIYEAMEYFVDLVEQKVGDQISITIHPNGELGSNQEVYEQVKVGAPIIQNSDPGYLSDYVPDFGILNAPYLLSDPRDFSKILDSDLYAEMTQDLRETAGFELLSTNWFFGARHIISDREIRTPADMEGLTIRVPPNTMWIETMKAMGGRPTQLAWSEVYSGLSTGVVGAAEAPLASLYAAKLFETKDTVSMTGHFRAFVGLVMNSDLYASFPQEVQEALSSSAIEAGEYMTDLVIESEEEYIGMLEVEGVGIVRDVDEAAFREATAGVYDAFPAWSDGLHERVNAILSE